MPALAFSTAKIDQAISLAFTLADGDFQEGRAHIAPSRFAHALNGIEDLLWLCIEPEGVGAADGTHYDRAAFTVFVAGTASYVRSISYNSPLEIVVEIVRHGTYTVAPAAVAATTLGLLRKWAVVRTELARSSTSVARARLERAAYDLIREEITLPRAENPAPGAERLREERLQTAADVLGDISEVRQLE